MIPPGPVKSVGRSYPFSSSSMIAESISGRFTSLLSTRTSFLVTSIFVSGCDPHTNFPTSSVLLAFGELRQTNIDLGLAGNARIVANAADPFDTPEQIVIRERSNCVNSLAHWQIITESESIKEPRGRSRSQSYSQIALLHSHLFLHDQLTFADISGTDTSRPPTHGPSPAAIPPVYAAAAP